MTDEKCTVVVKNDSSDLNEPHKYFAYFVEQKVVGGQLTRTLQPVFFSTEKLDSNSQNEFNISSQLYAVIAKRLGYTGKHPIANNDKISLMKTDPVDIGRRGVGGSALVVRWNNNDERPVFDENLKEKSAKKGCFNISCQAAIPRSNKYVVGLAREINGTMRPVAVVPCTPETNYQFTPKDEIYIERCSPENKSIEKGTIVSASTREFGRQATLGLQFDSEEIKVNEKPSGFYVNGSPSHATSVAAEEPEFDEAQGRTPPPPPPPPHRASTSGIPQQTPAPQQPSQERSRSHPDPRAREPSRQEQDSAGIRPTDRAPPSAAQSGSGGGRASNTAHQSSPDPRPNQQGHSSAHESAPSSATAGQASREANPPPPPPPASSSSGPEAQYSGGTTEEPGGADDESGDEALYSFKRLRHFHTVFVVDDTDSMLLPASGDHTGKRQAPPGFEGKTRWDTVLEALQHIAGIAVEYDESGIDVHFLVRSWHDRQGIKNSSQVRQVLEKIGIELRKRGSGPTKFAPALEPILDGYVEDYRKWKAPGSETDGPRPLDLIVLTDGAAEEKHKKATEDLIVKTARTLTKLRAMTRQVGIEFVQVGEDTDATQFLKHLDDDLEKLNVRDVSRSLHVKHSALHVLCE
jgi:hypothetical protein